MAVRSAQTLQHSLFRNGQLHASAVKSRVNHKPVTGTDAFMPVIFVIYMRLSASKKHMHVFKEYMTLSYWCLNMWGNKNLCSLSIEKSLRTDPTL